MLILAGYICSLCPAGGQLGFGLRRTIQRQTMSQREAGGGMVSAFTNPRAQTHTSAAAVVLYQDANSKDSHLQSDGGARGEGRES